MVLQLTGETKKMETKKRMTKNLKLMLFGGALSVLLCFAVIASFPTVKVKTVYSLTPVPNTAITPTALKPYVLETPFAEVDIIIDKYANTSYYAVNMSNWDNFLVSTNASYVINSVTQLGGQHILLKPDVVIDSPILLQNLTHFEFDGVINASAGCTAIFKNKDTCNYGIIIEGHGTNSIIDGNGIATCGVNFTQTTDRIGVYYPTYQIKSFFVWGATSYGILINFTGSSGSTIWQDDVSSIAESSGAIACDWEYVCDSRLQGGVFDAYDTNQYTLSIKGCYSPYIHPTYMNGHHLFQSCDDLDFSCLFLDASAGYPCVNLWGVDHSLIHDTMLRAGSSNVDAGFYLNNTSGATCTDNVFSSIQFRNGTAAGDWFSYGIEESDNTQNYNIYMGISGRECGTGVIRFLGTNGNVTCTVGTVIYA